MLALIGESDIVENLDVIYTEINYHHIYENWALINEIDDYLMKHGFTRFMTKTIKDPDRTPMWGDAIYVEKNL